MADKQVKHSDIIEDKVFQPTSDSADILLGKINLLIAGMKQLAVITGKKIPLADPKTLSEAEQLAEALRKIKDLEGGLTAAQKVRIQAQVITNEQTKKYREELKSQTGAVENSTQALRRMQRELANLPAGSKEFNKLAKEAGLLKDKIGDAQAAVKAFSSESKLTNAKTLFGQIGNDLKDLNFADAADKARQFAGVIKSMTFAEVLGGIKNFGTAMVEMGKSLLLNPFVLTAAAVTALGIALFKVWESFDAGDKVLKVARENLKEVRIETQKLRDALYETRLQNDLLLGNISEGDANIFREKISLSQKLTDIEAKRAAKIKEINDKAEEELGLTQKISASAQLLFNMQKQKAIMETNAEFDKQARLAEQDSAEKRKGLRIKEQQEIEKEKADAKVKADAEKKKSDAELEKIATEKKKSNQKLKADITKFNEQNTINEEQETEANLKEGDDKILAITKKANEEKLKADDAYYAEYKKRQKQEYDDQVEFNRKKREQDEKDRLKRIADEVEAGNKINDAIFNAAAERNSDEQRMNSEKLSEIDRQIDFQQQLALNGEKNTLDELEKERAKALEEKQRLDKQAAQQKEAEQLGEIFLEFYKAYASEKEGAFGKAISATLKGAGGKLLASSLAGAFAEGVEDFKGKGTGTSDSNIIAFSKGESVLTAKGTKETSGLASAVNERGYLGAQEWAMKNVFPKVAPISDERRDLEVMRSMLSVIHSDNKELIETIKNKTEWTISENLFGEIIKARKQNGMSRVTTVKNTPIINGR